MIQHRILFFLIIAMISTITRADDSTPLAPGFNEDWFPTVIKGEFYLLDEKMQPPHPSAPRPMGGELKGWMGLSLSLGGQRKRVYPVLDDKGKIEEKDKSGKTYFKVKYITDDEKEEFYWIRKDKEDNFEFQHKECLELTNSGTEHTLKAGSVTRKLWDPQTPGLANSAAGAKYIRYGQVDCSANWIKVCTRDENKNWHPIWTPPFHTTICDDQYKTEATTTVECEDCAVSEVQRTAEQLQNIARQTRAKTDKDLLKYVPKNIHEVATEVAGRCWPMANYLVREMSEHDMVNLVSIYGATSGKNNAHVQACLPVLRRCFPKIDDGVRGNECSSSEYKSCYGITQKCRMSAPSGHCNGGVRETLQKMNMIPSNAEGGWIGCVPSPIPTNQLNGRRQRKHSAVYLEHFGFENKGAEYIAGTPPNAQVRTQNLPPGAVVLYADPYDREKAGHAEVFTGSMYCSDFCRQTPISQRTERRQPIAVYIKTSEGKPASSLPEPYRTRTCD